MSAAGTGFAECVSRERCVAHIGGDAELCHDHTAQRPVSTSPVFAGMAVIETTASSNEHSTRTQESDAATPRPSASWRNEFRCLRSWRGGERSMGPQKRKETRSRKPAEGEEGGVGTSELPEKGEKIKEELDKLLDELDDLLEENAEEFVASYVQRGGQ